MEGKKQLSRQQASDENLYRDFAKISQVSLSADLMFERYLGIFSEVEYRTPYIGVRERSR
jgi:hypothetical protein